MVKNKWRVYRSFALHNNGNDIDYRTPCWVARAPNDAETEWPTHTLALQHATRTATQRAKAVALILQAILRGRVPTADMDPSPRPPTPKHNA